MTESDDDIICVDTPAKSGIEDDEIQRYIDLFVDDEIENGRDANGLTLKEVIKRINATGYQENFLDDPQIIKRICKLLRKTQKTSKNRKKQVVDNNTYNGITGADLKTLEPNEWLNDNIINHYMKMIETTHPDRFVAISSFMPETLSHPTRKPEKIPDLTNKIALIPINTIAHWSLVVIFTNQKTIMMMDSMRTKTITMEVMEILKNIQKHLRDLRDEKFVVKLNTEVRQQTNSDDCGAFVCAFARCLAEGGKEINRIGQRQIPRFRKLLKEEIKSFALSPWSNFLASVAKTLNIQKDNSKNNLSQESIQSVLPSPPTFELMSD